MNFRVDLETFRGPLDLLLYLVRKHEVEVADLPVAVVTEQYLEYLSVLEEIDVNAVGDFLEVASTLIEIKSRSVLPQGDEVEEPLDDPRKDLVLRLLEYKKFRDAASMLEERSRLWQERYPRVANDLPARERNLADEQIREVELWDLVSAFSRVMRENLVEPASSIVYDDTPIHVYMEQIHDRLTRERTVSFSDLFPPAAHKSTKIGIFLAVLELVRHHGVLCEQTEPFGEIWIVPNAEGATSLELSGAEDDELKETVRDEAETEE